MSHLCNRAKRMRAGVSLFKVYNVDNRAWIEEAVVNSRAKKYHASESTFYILR